jgi:hypothetical protein
MLRWMISASAVAKPDLDWLRNAPAHLLAWWIPKIALVLGLFADVPVRAAIWIVALTWMGAACIINARRCGRTHCRYTGPFYLAMIAPVLVFALEAIALGFYGWVGLAVVILAGSRIIWWATERAWGAYS